MLPLLLLLLALSLSHATVAVHASGLDGATCEHALQSAPLQPLQPRCPWTQSQPTAAPAQSPFTFPYLQRLLAAVEAGSANSRHSRSGSMLQLRPDAPLAPLRPGALVGGAGAGAGSRSKLSERVSVGSGRAQLPQTQGGRFHLLERIHVISAGAGTHAHVAPWRGDSQQADSEGTESTALVEPGSSLQLDSYGGDDRLGTAPHSEHALATTTTATIPSATSPLSSSRPASAATSGLRGDSASGVGGGGGGTAGASSAGHDSGAPGSGSGSGVDHEYELRDRVGRGHFGEVWRARRIDSDETSAASGSGSSSGFGSEPATYVLKRLFVERGYRTRLSGLREIHFGLKVRAAAGGGSTGSSGGDPSIARHVSRLVEFFEEGGALWLVFRDEGLSLSQLMWTTGEGGAVVPSERWTRMKMQTGGIPTHFGRTSQQQRHQQSGQRQRNEPVDEEEERERRAYVQAHATDVAVLPSECAADDHASGSGSGSGDGGDYPPDAFGPFLPSPPPSTVSLVRAPPSASSAVAPVPLPLGLSAHEHEKDSSALQLALRLGDGEGAGDWGHLWPSIAEPATVPMPIPATTGALPFRQPAAALPTSSSSFTPRNRPAKQPRFVLDPPEDADTDGEEGGAQSDPFSSSQSHAHAPHAVEREFPHDDFKNIFYQLLQSLAALHQLGITHRDV